HGCPYGSSFIGRRGSCRSRMTQYAYERSLGAMSAQVIGVFIGPLAFGADLLLSYIMVPHACSTGRFYVLHTVSAVGLLIVLIGAWMSWRQYGNAREGS